MTKACLLEFLRSHLGCKEGTGSTFFFSLPADALGRSETSLGTHSGKSA